jgi:DNA repair protein RadC
MSTTPVHKRIKDMPASLLPREKMLTRGSAILTNAELVALLLNTGRKGRNVLSLAQLLITSIGFEKFTKVTLEDLVSIPGIGKTKATRLLASIELGKRLFAPVALDTVVLETTQHIVKELLDIASARQEMMVVLYLNARSELIHKERVAVGGVNVARVLPREILGPAVGLACTEFVIAHNHPSGNPTPSEEDIAFTKQITQAGELMGITLRDHIIISSHRYFSFANGRVYEKR